jgi:hypothetical protein
MNENVPIAVRTTNKAMLANTQFHKSSVFLTFEHMQTVKPYVKAMATGFVMAGKA